MYSRSDQYDLLKLTTQIVSTYVTHQRLSSSELPTLIDGVYRALAESVKRPLFKREISDT